MREMKYRHCWFCGKPFQMPIQAPNKRFCSPACAHRQGKAIRRLARTSLDQKQGQAA